MSYTEAQGDAIHIHDRNLIVTAGAGSGKTRVLVDRFIALLDIHPDWPLPSLVAITFTEKAAREMRDRVRQTIEERIARATEAGQEKEIQRWRAHEAALDSARIGTIHSLCATILRANAAEIGIDPGFEVLDEIEATIVLADAIDEALAALAEQPVARLLIEYGAGAVRDVLRSSIAVPPDSLPGTEDYLAKWREAYPGFVIWKIDQLRQNTEFLASLYWEPSNGWPAASDKRMQVWQAVLDSRDRLLSPETPTDDILRILAWLADGINLRGGSEAAWGGKEIFEDAKKALESIRAHSRKVLQEMVVPDGADEKAAELLPLWGEAIRQTQQVYQSVKWKRRALDFNDLESMTRQLLRNPEIAARYRDREFRHILVDEFQDTNDAQRDIIYGLAGLDRPGMLFVVGDPRQSIYRFRGADVSIFNKVRGEILSTGGHEITLDTSFRTHSGLVDGFNAIFTQLLTRNGGPTVDYEVELGQPMTAMRNSETHHSPCMEIILIDENRAEEGRASADELRRWEAWEIAKRLRQKVEAGWLAWDKHVGEYRPLLYGDIAVLFQATNNMPLVEEIFKAAEIPYVTIAGRGYYSRPEVWDLLNLLKALYNPLDDLSLASALRSPLYGLSDDDLFALRLQRNTMGARLPLWNALTDSERLCEPVLPDPHPITFARESLLRLRGIAGRVTIAALLAQALEETAYLATLSGLTDGARRCANVDKLLEIARRSKRIALGDFTAYLQDLSEREAREGEALIETEGAVQLMTVHASKGLEFPVVSLFDASWEWKGRTETLVIDPQVGPACCVSGEDGARVEPFALRLAKQYEEMREAAERKRLLYVGMTRAQDYVMVSGRADSKGSWLKQLCDTLGLAPGPEVEQIIRFAWGSCLLHVPKDQPPPEYYAPRGDQASTAWDQLNANPMPEYESHAPMLAVPVLVDRQAPARMLSATEIGILGEAKATGNLANFRHQVLRDAPGSVHDVAGTPLGAGISQRIIGEMVHQALRWGRLPSNAPDLRRVLDSYAWEQGITDPQMIEHAIEQATDLLERTEHSEVIQQIRQASQVYHELPFTLRLGERTISGVIDMLYFSKYQRWNVVDFKTSEIYDDGTGIRERIAAHAARYHAQVGIYALAVETMTGQIPDTHLHYVRYVQTVKVQPEVWQAVLQSLDADIAEALSE